MKCDLIIIGGGVLGISLLYHLRRSGLKIVLLEKEATIGQHASGKNAGMIRQLYRHPQLTSWAERSIASWPSEIKEQYFKEKGSIILGRKCPQHHTHLFKEGLLEVKESEKNKSLPYVFTKTDGLLDSGGYLNGIRSLIREDGIPDKIQIRCNTRVNSITRTNSNWLISTSNEATSSKEQFTAPLVVNAAGAWVNSFLENDLYPMQIEVEAYARYLFLTKGWNEKLPANENYGFYWDEVHEWYLREWSEDEFLVSACDTIPADPDNFTPSTNIEENISSRILACHTQLSQSVALGRSWHCFRTYTEDSLPVWGEDEEYPGFFWLAGFGGFGMSTSFAASQDAASYLLGDRIIYHQDFAPIRVKRNIELTVNA